MFFNAINAVTGWSGMRVGRKRTMVAGLVMLGCIMAFGAATSPDGNPIHEGIEWLGMLLIFLCVFGRTGCSIYVGGKKNDQLMRVGPYSICRNPLYLFSILGAAGVGAQFGSITTMLGCGIYAWVVMYWLVLSEEEFLSAKFGADYEQYCARVPRFIPRPWLWQGPEVVEINVPIVFRTFLDACIFLVAVPLAEIYEYLQIAGYIPVFFHLP